MELFAIVLSLCIWGTSFHILSKLFEPVGPSPYHFDRRNMVALAAYPFVLGVTHILGIVAILLWDSPANFWFFWIVSGILLLFTADKLPIREDPLGCWGRSLVAVVLFPLAVSIFYILSSFTYYLVLPVTIWY